jgi:hypothetical protein
VKTSGRKIFFRYGGDAVRTRMYRSFAQLREGWTKNLALLFSSPFRLAVLRLLEFVLIAGSAVLAFVTLAEGRWRTAFLLGSLVIVLYVLLIQRIRRAHFPWDANLLSLLGLPLFSYLLLRSARAHKRGRVDWKGRQYGKTGATELMLRVVAAHETRPGATLV